MLFNWSLLYPTVRRRPEPESAATRVARQAAEAVEGVDDLAALGPPPPRRRRTDEEPDWKKRAPRWVLVTVIGVLCIACGVLAERVRGAQADEIRELKARQQADHELLGQHNVTLEGQSVRIAMWAATAQETLIRVKSLEAEQYAALRRQAAAAGDAAAVRRLTRKLQETTP